MNREVRDLRIPKLDPRLNQLAILVLTLGILLLLTTWVLIAVTLAPAARAWEPNRPTIVTDERAPVCCQSMHHLSDAEYDAWIDACITEEGYLNEPFTAAED